MTLDPAEPEERQPPRILKATIYAYHPGKTGHKAAVAVCSSTAYKGSSDLDEFSDEGETFDEIDLVACKPVAFEMHQSTPGVRYVKDGDQIGLQSYRGGREEEQCTLRRGQVQTQRMTAVTSWILGLEGRILSRAWQSSWSLRSQGLHQIYVVCREFSLQPAQYPLEPELESSISLSLHTVSMKKKPLKGNKDVCINSVEAIPWS